MVNTILRVQEVDRDLSYAIGQGPSPEMTPTFTYFVVVNREPMDDEDDLVDLAVTQVLEDFPSNGFWATETEWVDERTVSVLVYKN